MEDIKSYIKNSDCFNEFKNINDNTVDLVCVDLPYGQTACKWDSVIDLSKMWIELKRICKDKAVYVFFCTTKFGNSLINSNKKWFRYDIVWEKSLKLGWFNAKKQPLRKHEMLYIFYQKRGTYNPQKTKGKPWKVKEHKLKNTDVYNQSIIHTQENKTGDRHPHSILKFNNPKKSIHRTQKPVSIIEWIIKSYSNENDVVLDFTMGSGSTVEACINTNRKYIGIEKDKDIFLIAKNRIKNINCK